MDRRRAGQADFKRVRLVLGRSPHFRSLPGDTLDALARMAAPIRLKDGELIQPAWKATGEFYLILKGGLRISMSDAEGGFTVLAVLGEGSYYGGGTVSEEEPIPLEAVSVGRTDLAGFDFARMRAAFAGNLRHPAFLMRLMQSRLLGLLGIFRDVVALPLPQRLARRILTHALAAGHTGAEVEVRVSQAEFATMLGVGRTTISAALRHLERDGVVRLGYRCVRVRDFRRLCTAAGPGVLPL